MIKTSTFGKLALVTATVGALAVPAAANAMDRRGENALVGGLLGAAAGGLIGGDATGALVGAGAGAFLGAATTRDHHYRGGYGYRGGYDGYRYDRRYDRYDGGYGYRPYRGDYRYGGDRHDGYGRRW